MLRKLLKNSFLILVWLGLWAAAAALVNRTLLLPSPLETAGAFASLAESGVRLAAALSVSRILSGLRWALPPAARWPCCPPGLPGWRFAALSVVNQRPSRRSFCCARVDCTSGVPVSPRS